jgi:hypothetical protein
MELISRQFPVSPFLAGSCLDMLIVDIYVYFMHAAYELKSTPKRRPLAHVLGLDGHKRCIQAERQVPDSAWAIP